MGCITSSGLVTAAGNLNIQQWLGDPKHSSILSIIAFFPIIPLSLRKEAKFHPHRGSCHPCCSPDLFCTVQNIPFQVCLITSSPILFFPCPRLTGQLVFGHELLPKAISPFRPREFQDIPLDIWSIKRTSQLECSSGPKWEHNHLTVHFWQACAYCPEELGAWHSTGSQ